MSIIDTGPGWRSISTGSVKPDPDLDRVSLGQHVAIRRRIDRIWARVVPAPSPSSTNHDPHLSPGDFLHLHAQLCGILFRAQIDPAQARRLGLHDLLTIAGRYDRDVDRPEFNRFMTSVATSWSPTMSVNACVDVLARIEDGLRSASSPMSWSCTTSMEGAQQIDVVRRCQSLAEAGLYSRLRTRAGEHSGRRLQPGPSAPSSSSSGWTRVRAWVKNKFQSVPRMLPRWSSADRTRTRSAPSTGLIEPVTRRPVTLLIDAQPSSDSLSDIAESRPRAQSMPELVAQRPPVMMPPRSASVVLNRTVTADAAQQAEKRLNAIVAGRKRIEALIGRMQSSDGDSDDRDMNPNFNDQNNDFQSHSDLSSSWSIDQRRERRWRLLHRMKARSEKVVQWPRDKGPARKSNWSESD